MLRVKDQGGLFDYDGRRDEDQCLIIEEGKLRTWVEVDGDGNSGLNHVITSTSGFVNRVFLIFARSF